MYIPELTENALTVLKARYFAPGEDWAALCKRVSHNLTERETPEAQSQAEAEFYRVMFDRLFLPNSPTLMNAGRELQQLSACYVLPVDDNLDSIFKAVRDAAIIHQSGGGTGFDFSRLRPKGSMVKGSGGTASGPVSFIDVFDAATGAIKQGGKRRGANMAILRVDHPDIMEFIQAKMDPNRLQNFNVSVGVTDKFMRAVIHDTLFTLIHPNNGDSVAKPRAKAIWAAIVACAHATGDPGLVFLDAINSDNPNPQLGLIESTNPCGEQPLLPYESCNLGSVNLRAHVAVSQDGLLPGQNGYPVVDYPALRKTIQIAVRMLDNVITMNEYPLADIAARSRATRRIGVGVMGWADLLIALGIPYGSSDALLLADAISDAIRRYVHEATTALAVERGPYPEWAASMYAEVGGEPWRNTAPVTIAPTGTISTIAGVSSGIEPLYALSYERNVLDGKLVEFNEAFAVQGKREGWFTPIVRQRMEEGYPISSVAGIPSDVKALYATAHEISPQQHIDMQAAWQRHTDNAVSKTINMPESATVEDVADAYMLAWELHCKGVTIYRDRSRAHQVLETPVAVVGKLDGSDNPFSAKDTHQTTLNPAEALTRMDRVDLRAEGSAAHVKPYQMLVADASGPDGVSWGSPKPVEQATSTNAGIVFTDPSPTRTLIMGNDEAGSAERVMLELEDDMAHELIRVTDTERAISEVPQNWFDVEPCDPLECGNCGNCDYEDDSHSWTDSDSGNCMDTRCPDDCDGCDCDKVDDGTLASVGRQRKLNGRTYKYGTGHGALYVTVNRSAATGGPIEVFLTLGKADNCNSANTEAIGRLATLALRNGASALDVAAQVSGVTCCPAYDHGEQVMSMADALAKALYREVNDDTPADASAYNSEPSEQVSAPMEKFDPVVWLAKRAYALGNLPVADLVPEPDVTIKVPNELLDVMDHQESLHQRALRNASGARCPECGSPRGSG